MINSFYSVAFIRLLSDAVRLVWMSKPAGAIIHEIHWQGYIDQTYNDAVTLQCLWTISYRLFLPLHVYIGQSSDLLLYTIFFSGIMFYRQFLLVRTTLSHLNIDVGGSTGFCIRNINVGGGLHVHVIHLNISVGFHLRFCIVSYCPCSNLFWKQCGFSGLCIESYSFQHKC